MGLAHTTPLLCAESDKIGKIIDLSNQKIGRLYVCYQSPISDKYGHKLWICKCDCGNIKSVTTSDLMNGRTTSCGCFQKERRVQRATIHGMTGSSLHNTWKHMKDRIYNVNCADYNNYGGRGITLCKEWDHDFMAFYNWSIAHGYKDDLTIDRIDNNGPYSPENCRWVNRTVQNNNRRSCRIYSYNGKTMTLQQWANQMGVSRSCLDCRLKRGWSVEKTFSTPKLKH